MLQSYLGKIIVDFCSFYGKSAAVLSSEDGKVQEFQLMENSEVLKGLRNLVSAVCNVKGKTLEDSALQDQWIEYSLTNAAYLQNSSNSPHMLKVYPVADIEYSVEGHNIISCTSQELNEYLADKVYFVGDELNPVDVLMYLFIFDVMVVLTFQDKEKYMNISRWFSNLQQEKKLSGTRPQICFSRTRLYA